MEILKEIKLICGKYGKCDTHCPFYDRHEEKCCVVDTEPEQWDIERIIHLVGKHSATMNKLSALDNLRTELKRQEKWLLQVGYTIHNVDIAFDAIKAVIAESEE